MGANGISRLATKQLRQEAKLDLAADKSGETYNTDYLPAPYVDDVATPNVLPDGLLTGRPWVERMEAANPDIVIEAPGGGGETDPFGAQVQFLLGIDSAASPQYFDRSQNNLTGEITGTHLGPYSPGINGSPESYRPNFASDVLRFNTPLMAFGTGDFTVEFYMQTLTGAGTSDGLLSNHLSGSARWVFWHTETGTYVFGDGDQTILTCLHASDVDLRDGNPHHVAWTRDSGINKLWIDGVEIDSYDDGSHNYGDLNQFLCIGEDEQAVSRRWGNGLLDGVRVTIGVARYTETFTPPSLPLPDPTL